MSGVNFFKFSIFCLAPLMIAACQPPDFGEIKPDLSKLKQVPASILNIGKINRSSKSEKDDIDEMDTP